jgi:hypothetical protein
VVGIEQTPHFVATPVQRERQPRSERGSHCPERSQGQAVAASRLRFGNRPARHIGPLREIGLAPAASVPEEADASPELVIVHGQQSAARPITGDLWPPYLLLSGISILAVDSGHPVGNGRLIGCRAGRFDRER